MKQALLFVILLYSSFQGLASEIIAFGRLDSSDPFSDSDPKLQITQLGPNIEQAKFEGIVFAQSIGEDYIVLMENTNQGVIVAFHIGSGVEEVDMFPGNYDFWIQNNGILLDPGDLLGVLIRITSTNITHGRVPYEPYDEGSNGGGNGGGNGVPISTPPTLLLILVGLVGLRRP